jgi:serine phosphatase RsbU (regulator of sigma subunit)
MNIIKIGKEEIEIASAAMPPVYLYNAVKKEVEEIMFESLPLGSLKNVDYDLITKSFKSGDILIQVSDGLPEAPNSIGEMYDYDRLKNLIQKSSHLSAQALIKTLVSSVDEWMEGQNNPDDITLVVTKKI